MQHTKLALARGTLLFISIAATFASADSWKTNEEAAAKASRSAQFAKAQKLLTANLKFVETLPAKDARLRSIGAK